MIDKDAAARAIDDFLRALGHEPVDELAGTGARVAAAWADDLLQGYEVDPAAVLAASVCSAEEVSAGASSASGAQTTAAPLPLVVVRELAVTTMCPHHLLPAYGTGLVAYLPGARVVGIGALAQVLDAFARRLTLQERIGIEVAEILVRELGARGALCKLSLTHMCLVARGERKTGAIVETLSVAGTFAAAGPDRDLALAAVGAPMTAGILAGPGCGR
jgi:GTP cyclohydrolase I